MPWYVYDYDPKGRPIQRGPYPSSARAQRELDNCENAQAEMLEFRTQDPSRAKRQFKELRCQRHGLSEGIRRFRSAAVREKEKSRETFGQGGEFLSRKRSSLISGQDLFR